MKIVVATHNKHKVDEIREFFKDDFEVLSADDIGSYDEIEETGDTIEENALLKARSLANLTDYIVIADDTGLFVDYLDGKPGVYSARFAGSNATYEDNNRKLLRLLEGVPIEKRKATFRTVVALIYKGKETIIEGKVEGTILDSPRGQFGFGYDPVFFVDKVGKTLAELTLEEKNEVSHRANALKKLKEYLKNNLEDFK
ncbi:non-canonical purine NTP pyrophosphatase, RdgB/HAM1 family [Thermoanaerobacterium thermosaccharolyticum]|jgi:XTP/dITP diphosphohydrolase|uniref:dITP/XTP pyrophosphatase n=2 Tax=Thermoanaerobacterium thermosaccharolyticum TaxID=1517 RepID=D9TQ24_THETC|nr:XTP/dITP diphosphatase [Thermoanaerobacterium thermosaccharolyticum]ADL69556.1 non-canonical purine NTP pyrophosphatase, rdgB/HAM1 family [Thermoanaerobacterium thermosaccharolyticum DSM 571]AST56712.1 non-canonical purine NTP pyrophosphatase, RdgB/HAM1 family [Thermoanaerobacterium thermosaccharolyticum]MBE0070040.1 XTP/dITP diphosphatase [Thermoanaerobacterium thermosaccharolyticum]MBE0229574.1 XTP/dITP diphosphatase [Thermoanaerobacterium thermosaccharolyticum]OXT07004.1 non-canonical pu